MNKNNIEQMKTTNSNLTERTETVFSSRLISAMDDSRMKGTDLANKLFLAPATITGYRKGYRTPDLYMFMELVNALDVSADYLIGRIDVPHPIYQESTPLESQIFHKIQQLSKEDQIVVASLIQNLLK